MPPLGGFREDIAMPFGVAKTTMDWLPDGENISKISLFVLAEFTNVSDTHTDRQTDTAWRHRPRLHSIARQKRLHITGYLLTKPAGQPHYYLIAAAAVFWLSVCLYVCLSVCLSVCEQDDSKSCRKKSWNFLGGVCFATRNGCIIGRWCWFETTNRSFVVPKTFVRLPLKLPK